MGRGGLRPICTEGIRYYAQLYSIDRAAPVECRHDRDPVGSQDRVAALAHPLQTLRRGIERRDQPPRSRSPHAMLCIDRISHTFPNVTVPDHNVLQRREDSQQNYGHHPARHHALARREVRTVNTHLQLVRADHVCRLEPYGDGPYRSGKSVPGKENSIHGQPSLRISTLIPARRVHIDLDGVEYQEERVDKPTKRRLSPISPGLNGTPTCQTRRPHNARQRTCLGLGLLTIAISSR